MLIEARDRSAWWDGFTIDGVNFAGDDTCGMVMRMISGGMRNCSFSGGAKQYLQVMGSPDTTVVESCTFIGHGNNNNYGVWWADTSRGSSFRGNTVKKFTNTSFPAMQIYGRNTVFEHNRWEESFTGTRVQGSDHVFRNNVYYDLFRAYLGIPGISGNQLINNTFCAVRYGAEIGSLCVVKNNLFTSMSGVGSCLDSLTNAVVHADSITYNLFDTLTSDLSHHMGDASNIITSVGLDVQLADTSTRDFHLRINSPCLDRGDISAACNDLTGGRNDMGAYGGPYAIDTLQPPVLDSLQVWQDGAFDEIRWGSALAGDLEFLAVYRDTSGADFVPAEENCIDSIYNIMLPWPRYTHNDKRWHYKVNQIDSSGYAGGYAADTARYTNPRIADVSYYSCGTENVTDDSMVVVFNIDFSTFPEWATFN